MRCHEVRFSGFKGRSRMVRLAPRTVLTGPNGSGKTTVLQAVQVGLIGYEPRSGPRSVGDLASADVMQVGLTLVDDDGRELAVEREFAFDGEGKVTQKARIYPSLGEKTVRAVEERLRAEVGDCAVMLDLGEFLRLTPGKRAEMLGQMMGASGAKLTASDFVSRLVAADAEIDGASVLAIVVRVWSKTASAPANLEAARKALAAALSEASGREREAAAALRSFTGDRNAADPVPNTAAELEAERTTLRDRVSKLEAEIRADDERSETVRRATAELESARADRIKAERALASAQTQAAEIRAANEALVQAAATAEARLAEVQAQLDGLVEPAEPCGTDAEEERVVVAEREERLAAESPWRTVEALAHDLDKAFENAEVGPLKVSKKLDPARPTHAVALLQLAARHGGDTARLALATREAREQLRLAKEADAAAAKTYDAFVARRKELREARGTAQDAAKEARRAATKAVNPDVATAAAAAALTAAQQRETRAGAALDAVPGTIDRESVEALLRTLRTQVAELDAKLRAKEQARGVAEQALKADERARTAAAAAKALRGAQGAAKTAAAEILAESFRPLTGAVTDLLSAVRRGWSLEALAEDGGIALVAHTGEGRAIRWGALSGGEAVIFGAALSLALVRLQNPPAKLLLIEAAEVDERNLPALLDALGTMGAEFDSIIVATCHGQLVHERSPWHVVDLAEADALAGARS